MKILFVMLLMVMATVGAWGQCESGYTTGSRYDQSDTVFTTSRGNVATLSVDGKGIIREIKIETPECDFASDCWQATRTFIDSAMKCLTAKYGKPTDKLESGELVAKLDEAQQKFIGRQDYESNVKTAVLAAWEHKRVKHGAGVFLMVHRESYSKIETFVVFTIEWM